MNHSFPSNRVPNIARTNKFLRPFIIVAALAAAVLGVKMESVDSTINSAEWKTDITKKSNKLKLRLKMVYCRFAYEFTYGEFVAFGFEEKSIKEILEYISFYEKVRLYKEVIIPQPTYDEFLNKYKTYLMYKDYFKRDVIYLESIEQISEFEDFCKKHQRMVLKPIRKNGGEGIVIIDQAVDNALKLFMQAISESPLLCEEYITQCDFLSSYHPDSLNTLRYTTYYKDGKLTNLFALLRFGKGDSKVDNVSAGGYCVNINVDTGEIDSHGFTKSGVAVPFHEDTNLPFKGQFLPQWDELMKMCRELVEICPEQHLIGWDFCCTADRGWVVVEANAGPGVQAAQMCSGVGFRKRYIETVFKESKYFKEYSSAKL